MPGNMLAVSPERAQSSIPSRSPIKEDCHAAGWTFTELAQEQSGFASGDLLFLTFLKGLLGVDLFYFSSPLKQSQGKSNRT